MHGSPSLWSGGFVEGCEFRSPQRGEWHAVAWLLSVAFSVFGENVWPSWIDFTSEGLLVAIPAKFTRRCKTCRDWYQRSTTIIPLDFLKSCFLMDDVPTTNKVFHRFHLASRQYLSLPQWPHFRAEKKGDPLPVTAGAWSTKALGPIPALCRLGNTLPKNIAG